MDKDTLRKKLIETKPFDKKQPYVFISYCHADYECVWHDVIALKRRGLNIWIDCENVNGWIFDEQKDWSEQALPALKHSKACIVYFSEQSFQGKGFAQECIYLKEHSDKKFFKFAIGFKCINNNIIGDLVKNIQKQADEDIAHLEERKVAFRYISGCTNPENYYIEYKTNSMHLNNYDFENSLQNLFPYEYVFSSETIEKKISELKDLKTTDQKLFNEIAKYCARKNYYLCDSILATNAQYFTYLILRELKVEFEDARFNSLLRFFYNIRELDFENNIVRLNTNAIRDINIENDKLIELSIIEDELKITEWYNTQYAAKNFTDADVKLNYTNYLFGQLICITYEISNYAKDAHIREQFRGFFNYIRSNLFDESRLDSLNHGWCNYRFPWITARILIACRRVFSELSPSHLTLIKQAINSIIDRYNDDYHGWKSGANSWVPDIESTGLCMESLMLYDDLDWVDHKTIQSKINSVISYWLNENKLKEWIFDINFDNADKNQINYSTGVLMFLSVLYRSIKKYYPNNYGEEQQLIRDVLYFYGYQSIAKNELNAIQGIQVSTETATIAYLLLAVKGE